MSSAFFKFFLGFSVPLPQNLGWKPKDYSMSSLASNKHMHIEFTDFIYIYIYTAFPYYKKYIYIYEASVPIF